MAIAWFLDQMWLALQASWLWLRFAALLNFAIWQHCSHYPEGCLLLHDLVLDGVEVLHPGHQDLGVLHPALAERLGHLSQSISSAWRLGSCLISHKLLLQWHHLVLENSCIITEVFWERLSVVERRLRNPELHTQTNIRQPYFHILRTFLPAVAGLHVGIVFFFILIFSRNPKRRLL